ncbi:CENP-Q, a CENPA-CAD centromere complex subunit-domain-containing protein [Podospora didyma]|uniref:CENP-Q, a CENPA-CAD centromere complex subunit-domain-containing protein n=1 Tax=Podospora didyma TaxID=330526 RepID=A0AAE0NU49_9PEZI|nr:CENP-Q, a CENPA-CAD centromere complex subunit-domain-containing protein [Podospora didyma]
MDSPGGQKKRGRPRKSLDASPDEEASVAVVEAQNGPTAQSSNTADGSKPKKRGRAQKVLEEARQPEEFAPMTEQNGDAVESSVVIPKRRGRPGKDLHEKHQEVQAVPVAEKDPDFAEPSDVMETSMPKRRGRPGKSRNPESAINDPEAEETEPISGEGARTVEHTNVTENLIPKRRGRRVKNLDAGLRVDEPPDEQERPVAESLEEIEVPNPKKKRGRPGKGHEIEPNAEEPSAEEPRPRKRIKQAATTALTTEEEVAKPAHNKTQADKTPPDLPTQKTEHTQRDRDGEDGATMRRSGREPSSANNNPWWNTTASGDLQVRRGGERDSHGSSKNSSWGRPLLGEVSVSEAQNQIPASRRERSKKPERPPAGSNDVAGSSSQATGKISTKRVSEQKRHAGRSSLSSVGAEPQSTVGEQRNSEASRKTTTDKRESEPRRRRSGSIKGRAGDPLRNRDSHDEPSARDPSPKYRHLAPKTLQIPRSTIASKWTTLDLPSIAVIDSIVADASRPVLHKLRDRERRQQQAQTILQTFAARIHSRLVKGMPFPPATMPKSRGGRGTASAAVGTHENDFDFERTLDEIQALEKALDPLLHSVALLTSEKEREEDELEKAYAKVRTLENDAKTEAGVWRRWGKKDHVLAPEIRPVGNDVDKEPERALETVVKTAGDFSAGGVFKDLQEEKDLLALSQQIGSHLESMKGNLQQIDGVLPSIAKSKAVLQAVLHRHLDPQQYDQVLLG